jgi:hypothetical protein
MPKRGNRFSLSSEERAGVGTVVKTKFSSPALSAWRNPAADAARAVVIPRNFQTHGNQVVKAK